VKSTHFVTCMLMAIKGTGTSAGKFFVSCDDSMLMNNYVWIFIKCRIYN
jgi:hypothetical protein